MTIAIAVERYRAVVFPISLRQTIHTSKRMYHRRLCKYISSVLAIAILISIPRWVRVRTKVRNIAR